MATTKPSHTLYHHPYSICSIMVRYSFACRGELKDSAREMILDEEEIEIQNGGQFTERYLCEINHNGEVPVLVPLNGEPMPESVDITFYIAESYPSLMPTSHEQEIKRLTRKLHEISFFSLTFTGKPQNQQAAIARLEGLLEGNISDRYRAAIKYKIKRINETKLAALTERVVAENISRVQALMEEMAKIVAESHTDWCFSLKQPSALDAHLIVFIARMQDVLREDLIPETLRRYAAKSYEGVEWKGVMQGRRTAPPGSR